MDNVHTNEFTSVLRARGFWWHDRQGKVMKGPGEIYGVTYVTMARGAGIYT